METAECISAELGCLLSGCLTKVLQNIDLSSSKSRISEKIDEIIDNKFIALFLATYENLYKIE